MIDDDNPSAGRCACDHPVQIEDGEIVVTGYWMERER